MFKRLWQSILRRKPLDLARIMLADTEMELVEAVAAREVADAVVELHRKRINTLTKFIATEEKKRERAVRPGNQVSQLSVRRARVDSQTRILFGPPSHNSDKA